MAGSSAREFFQHCSYAFYWADLSDKIVMDIGCGKGNDSTLTFLDMFPNVGKIIAIDQNSNMIDAAQWENSRPKIEYHVADIELRSTLEQWEGQVRVIISFFCFNCLQHKTIAFQNVFRLLEPEGTAAILFTLQADCYDWAKKVGEMYSQYRINVDVEPPDTHVGNYPASHYSQTLMEIGFDIIQCDDESYTMEFSRDEECKDYLSSVCPITTRVPNDELDTFKENIFHTFLKFNPRNEKGIIVFRYRIAKILVKKPRLNEVLI